MLSGDLWDRRSLGKNPLYSEVLSTDARKALSSAVQAGWTLRSQWPRPTAPAVQRWLGQRFYFAHTHDLNASMRYGSIVCSQLGRHHQRLEQWPHLLDSALRSLHRDHSCLLSVPGITLHAPAAQFAQAAQLRSVELCLPAKSIDAARQPAHWLKELLLWVTNRREQSTGPHTIYVSPELPDSQQSTSLADFPFQDRASICLADHVLAVSVRPKGNIAGLLSQRLQEEEFPAGSLFLAVQRSRSGDAKGSSATTQWLDQGAVGWVVLQRPEDQLTSFSRCQLANSPSTRRVGPSPTGSFQTLIQFCVPASRLWTNNSPSWPYLAHCTRGSTGRLPQESEAAYFDRLWQAGSVHPSHPLLTLVRILREQRLRGTTWLTRGNLPSISLSAVPLKQLLSRRHFQSHLGRWDWEPYGLLFHQMYLHQARQVIYGRHSEFRQLSEEDRVYFQPVDSKYDWSQEREWRVLGDLDLRSLPVEAVTVFVRSRLEAVQLARESRFPVVWTEGILS